MEHATDLTKCDPASRRPAAVVVSLAALAPLAVFAAFGALAIPAGAADATTAPPPPPAAPAAPVAPVAHDADTDVDAQLEAARRKLEQAAREVARLSAQMSGRVIDSVMPYVSPRSIIGVQLESDSLGGARVREVSPGGPAAEAGIRAGDVLLAVNGTELKGEEPARQVIRIMRDVRPDSKVRVRVRRDASVHEYVVTARAGPTVIADLDLPDLPGLPRVREAFMLHRPLMDMELATLSPRLGSYFGSDKGVLVVRAPADGALKLEDGDVILSIDGREPASGSHATRILSSYQPGEKVTLRILRQHKALELQATMPDRPDRAHATREADVDAIYFDKQALRLNDMAQNLGR
jgi:S1-C subfamily serine protease